MIHPVVQHVFYANPDRYPPIVNSLRLLTAAGYQTGLFCRRTDEDLAVSLPDRANILRIDNRGRRSWLEYLSFVWAVLRRAKGDACLFVGHDMHGLLPAWLLSRRFRRPLVYHCHDFVEKAEGGGRYIKIFEPFLARSADLVIVPDAERGGEIARKLALGEFPLIVANAPLRQRKASGEDLLHTLETRGRHYQRILLRQGCIGPGHAIEATIRSMPLWASREWGFVLVGIGESEYLHTLTELARELCVEEQLAILPPVSYDEVLKLTPGADVGHALYEPVHINNRYITTASNKIMEYMAAGLPLLVSDRPSLRAFVETHGCGLTADEALPETIAASINTLLGDPELARRLGDAGRKAFLEDFTYERQFAPVLEKYKYLCGDREENGA